MPGIGPMEMIIVLAIALIVLGPKKLPDAGKSVGKGDAGVQGGPHGLRQGRGAGRHGGRLLGSHRLTGLDRLGHTEGRRLRRPSVVERAGI